MGTSSAMVSLTPNQYDLVYNSLSLGLASMAASTVFFFLRLPSFGERYKAALCFTGLVTFIAMYHYFRIFDSFVAAYTPCHVDEETGVFVLVRLVFRASDDHCTIGSGDGIHVLDATTHGLRTGNLWIIGNGINISPLIQVIIHADEEEVVPLCLVVRIIGVINFVRRPREAMAVQISLGFFTRVWVHVIAFLDPAQVSVIARILVLAPAEVAVSVIIVVLSVSMPAANGSVSLRTAILKSRCWRR